MTAVVENRGITEAFWGAWHEDKKLCWDLFSQAVAFVAALFVLKTGVLFVDVVIGIFTAFTPRLILRSQRGLSKHSERVRTRLSNAMVLLSTGGVLVLGLLYYGLAVIQAIATTYLSEVRPIQHRGTIFTVVFALMFLVVGIYAPIIAWRRLMLSEILIHAPKRALTRLFIDRAYMADQFESFARFEITIQFAGYAYATVSANLVSLYIALFRIP